MIKGCNKRVIVMKDTGNDMIEEAFFILKPDVSQSKNKQSGTADILKQASLILDAKGCEQPFSDVRLNVNKPYKKRSRNGNPFRLLLCAIIRWYRPAREYPF